MRARPQHAAASLLCTGGRYGSALPLGVQLQAAGRRSEPRVQLLVSAVCAPRTGCSCTCVGLCAQAMESSCTSPQCALPVRVVAAPAWDCALLGPSSSRAARLRSVRSPPTGCSCTCARLCAPRAFARACRVTAALPDRQLQEHCGAKKRVVHRRVLQVLQSRKPKPCKPRTRKTLETLTNT